MENVKNTFLPVTKMDKLIYFILLIIFNKKPNNEWILGQKFFNNYKFVFDLEEGKIGYYKTYNSNNGFILFSCLAICGIIIGIGYLRGYINKINIAQRNNRQIPYVVRKEYAQVPEEKKEINKINKKNENKNKVEDKFKKD